MSTISIRRHSIILRPECERVIVRPFIPDNKERTTTIIGRALALTEKEVEKELKAVCTDFESRHIEIKTTLMNHYDKVQKYIFTHRKLSGSRQLLIGALFSGEYALESSALFNPSIVPHPNQAGVPEGSMRFIMSLRATGEGHISSIEFRVGMISPDGIIKIDEVSPFVTLPEVVQNPSYNKKRFLIKLHEMEYDNGCTLAVIDQLGDEFTRSDLAYSVALYKKEKLPITKDNKRTLESVQWLADSNYEIQFSSDISESERIIFPASTNESNGIEDARFVRFIDDDGTVTYYATYTAFNGHDILPQILETKDFERFRVITLNGDAVQNKGMALFPRRVNGNYAMLSRQDDENIFIMYSDNPHYWNSPQIILRPAESWESVKIGNCGSPLETEHGWLVITHGVGAMRKYCIGAALLDINDPGKVIGRLRKPLLCPGANERDGYVPNVVYSCGSLIHNNELILPYAMSDQATTIISISLDELLNALRN